MLQKRFLRKKRLFKSEHISTGIVLGLISSFGYYGIFYFLRETFRVLGPFFGANVAILLTKTEHFVYNLFFGAIASALGYYVFVKFTVENSTDHHDKRLKRRQRAILNNQSFFGWSFLSAFGRFGAILGLCYLMIPIQFDLDFYTEFGVLLLLLPLVLFLNLWTEITRATLSLGFKYLGRAAAVFCITSLIYAATDFYAYQTFDDAITRNQLYRRFDFDMPRSITHSTVQRKSLVANLQVARDSVGNPRIFIHGGKSELGLSGVRQFLTCTMQ